MPRPKKWPTHALAALEDAVYGMKQIEALTLEAQEHLTEGENLAAMFAMSKARNAATQAKSRLLQARSGQYEEVRKC